MNLQNSRELEFLSCLKIVRGKTGASGKTKINIHDRFYKEWEAWNNDDGTWEKVDHK